MLVVFGGMRGCREVDDFVCHLNGWISKLVP